MSWPCWIGVVMNSDIRIESFLPADKKHDFLVGSDWNGGHNAGVLLIRNTPWSKQFLEDWWNMNNYVLPPGLSKSGDNNALNAFLKQMPDFDHHVLVPPRCTLNSFAVFVWPHQKISDFYMSENHYHKGDFIAHAAGCDNKAGAVRLLLQEAK
jgi:hypothetical protein